MNIYRIPREGRTQQAYLEYVGALPWVFASDPYLSADVSNERVAVNGTIAGFDLLPPSVTAQDIMTERIKAKRDHLKFNGVLVSGKWFHTDADSRTQWLGLTLMGANVPAIPWTTRDGSEITLSPSLVSAVFMATATLDMTAFAVAKAHIAAMLASADPYSYDFSANWPATYTP